MGRGIAVLAKIGKISDSIRLPILIHLILKFMNPPFELSGFACKLLVSKYELNFFLVDRAYLDRLMLRRAVC